MNKFIIEIDVKNCQFLTVDTPCRGSALNTALDIFFTRANFTSLSYFDFCLVLQ